MLPTLLTPFHISLHGSVGVRKKKGFCFEACWAEEEECKQVVKQAWREGMHRRSECQNVLSWLGKCKKGLLTWHWVIKRPTGFLIQEMPTN